MGTSTNSVGAPPRIQVLVLNWNGREDTLQCLHSLTPLLSDSTRVLVVDNGSTDGSVNAIRQAFPTVEYIETGQNLGYAGGNNVGIRHALERGVDYVLVLNNDTIVNPAFLAPLVERAQADPKTAVLGSYIYYLDRPETLNFAGARWNDERAGIEWPGQDEPADTVPQTVSETAYVCGAAMLIRASALREIGLFDERFFLVYEEADWCFRARRAGYRCLMVPQSRIFHKVGAAFGSEQSPLRAYFSTRNELLWGRLNLLPDQNARLRRRVLARHRPSFPVGTPGLPLLRQLAWRCAQYLRDWRRLLADPVHKAARLGLRDYFLGRFGNCPVAVRALNAKWIESRRRVNADTGNVEPIS